MQLKFGLKVNQYLILAMVLIICCQMTSLIGESVSVNEDHLLTFHWICYWSSLVESLVLTIAFIQISKAKGLVFKISEYGIITGMMRPISEKVGSVTSDDENEYEIDMERTRSHINRKL